MTGDATPLPERLAREAVAPQQARIFGGSVPAGIRRATLERAIAAAIRAALDEAAKAVRALSGTVSDTAVDQSWHAQAADDAWSEALIRAAAAIEALKT